MNPDQHAFNEYARALQAELSGDWAVFTLPDEEGTGCRWNVFGPACTVRLNLTKPSGSNTITAVPEYSKGPNDLSPLDLGGWETRAEFAYGTGAAVIRAAADEVRRVKEEADANQNLVSRQHTRMVSYPARAPWLLDPGPLPAPSEHARVHVHSVHRPTEPGHIRLEIDDLTHAEAVSLLDVVEAIRRCRPGAGRTPKPHS